MAKIGKIRHSIQISILILTVICLTKSYIDLPLKIYRPLQKTGQVSYNFMIGISGYQQNISVSFQNSKKDSITSPSDMKTLYKQRGLKRTNYNKNKNHANIFGTLEVTSLEGYSFQGWKRYFMEAFLYIESRYYHDIQINLDQIDNQDAGELSQGRMSLGPDLKENKLYQQIKKNSDFIQANIVAVYSGVGQRNNRIQLGGYQEEYAKGDSKSGALLYEFPLKVSNNYWQLAVGKVFFSRSKNRLTDQFLMSPNLSLYKLSLQSQYIVFPQSMRNALQSYVQSENNQCKITQFLQCNNMSTIDISLSQFAFELTPNHFINISLYDLRREYQPQSKKVSFYIKLSKNISEIQIGSTILKQYYIAIDMDQSTFLFSPVNRFGNKFSSIYVLRFLAYFALFTIVMAIIVGIWASLSDPNRRNKVSYGRQGIQLITYQRPGGVLTMNNQMDG